MERLAREIESAFDGSEQPTDDQILHPECMDDVDVLEFYGGVRWQDMSGKMVVYSYAALTAFSPIAFKYYLPAYLLWTLNNADSIEYATEATLLALDPGSDKEMLHDFRLSKFALFDSEQVMAIKKFLWHFSSHEDLGEYADQALLNYWMKQP